MKHATYKGKRGIPPGTVEMFGEAMEQRLSVMHIIESVYQRFGFDSLTTPFLEYATVFKGHHGEGESLLFKLQDSSKIELVLRYDLTVPLARYISDHPEAPIPFKRYQIATVFRDDEVDKGHFREFTQCDGDIVGISDLTADAEVISLAYMGLSKLGFQEFIININHRKIINGISHKAGMMEKSERLKVQRALDEVSKFSEKWEHYDNPHYQDLFVDNIHAILKKRNLPEMAREVIQSAFTLVGNFDQKLSALELLLQDSLEAIQGINELREIVSYVVPEVKNVINLDLSLARGADYYTGFILEGSIPNIPVGAVLGGGRFDNLVENLGGPNLPAVGMAFGLERIMVSMTELNIVPHRKFVVRIIIIPQSEKQKVALLDFAKKLRGKGLSVDYVPMFSSTKSEIVSYAKSRGFTVLITSNGSGIQFQQIKNEEDMIDLSFLDD